MLNITLNPLLLLSFHILSESESGNQLHDEVEGPFLLIDKGIYHFNDAWMIKFTDKFILLKCYLLILFIWGSNNFHSIFSFWSLVVRS